MNVLERLTSKTPKFFQVIRNVSLTLTAISAIVISMQTAGLKLPEWVSMFFNWYVASSAIVATVISQLTTIWQDKEYDVETKSLRKAE